MFMNDLQRWKFATACLFVTAASGWGLYVFAPNSRIAASGAGQPKTRHERGQGLVVKAIEEENPSAALAWKEQLAK